ncbi:MAG: putative oxidoreductase [Pelotomaculum thermopropionicum]|uniref:Putative oxidoreductase n=1 Tax=Pelotomaculum thermopropionicum TaxID=110500 RepID=A0A101HVD0_9FIRM|nr:MAG: putative oxidoreductase [Pelotomaculum thermopropionicum]
MQYRVLGRTGLKVSRLCFGALTVGPLQARLSIKEGAKVIRKALEAGVNFIDTAELYRTYPYIREAIRGYTHKVIVASKCYAYTYDGMRQSVEKALVNTGRDWIDIFMLHEQESILTIKGHWAAIEYLLMAKEKGLVRAVGISTHHVEGVLDAASVPEIDVIHPLINMTGIGIRGGNTASMLKAIKTAAGAGKGLYAMKALGGGNLIDRKEEAFDFVRSITELSSIAVGMSTLEEVAYNTCLFDGRPVEETLQYKIKCRSRRLHIEDWCRGCGRCVEICTQGALSIINGKPVVDKKRCIFCGYCGAACPDFCIKVI